MWSYHAKGEVYYKCQLNSSNNGVLDINVQNYPKGIYIIKLQLADQDRTIKLYKQ